MRPPRRPDPADECRAIGAIPAQSALSLESASAESLAEWGSSHSNARPVQRAIRITKVDFNPDVAAELEATEQPIDAAFRNFGVRAAGFRERLMPWVRQNNPVAYPAGNQPIATVEIRTGFANRLRELNDTANIEAPDVPSSRRDFAAHLQGDFAMADGDRGKLRTAVQEALGSVSYEL